MKWTLRQLEYVVAVADHLHFGAAAQACGVSQPSLSNQVAKLETVLGVTLFARGRGGVRITEAGEEILRRARLLLLDAASLAAGPTLQGSLRLGVVPTLAPFLLPAMLNTARRQEPGLRVLPREAPRAVLREALGQGRLDLVLAPLPQDDPTLAMRCLLKEHLLLAMPEGRDDVAGERAILLTTDHSLAAKARDILIRAGAEPDPALRAGSLWALAAMVAQGLGCSLLPGLAAKSLKAAFPGIELRPLARPGPSRQVGLCWRATDPRGEVFHALAGTLSPSRASPPPTSPIRG